MNRQSAIALVALATVCVRPSVCEIAYRVRLAPDSFCHPCIWLPTPVGLNNYEQACGPLNPEDTVPDYLWDGNSEALIPIEDQPPCSWGSAFDLNDLGDVVGSASCDGSTSEAALW